MVVIINYGTCARKGNGWWGGETTLKNTARVVFYLAVHVGGICSCYLFPKMRL